MVKGMVKFRMQLSLENQGRNQWEAFLRLSKRIPSLGIEFCY